MLVIDKFSRKPIYEQVVEGIERDIVMGILRDREQLPSIRELSAILGVNPNTIQKALFELEWIGLIVTERTSGKYVTKDQNVLLKLRDDKVAKIIEDFFNSMDKIGIDKDKALQIINDNKEIV